MIVDDEAKENLVYNKLTRNVPGGGGEKRTALVSILESTDDAELLCQLLLNFEDASSNENLRLNTAALLFRYFRQCLRGEERVNWDTARREIVINMVGFNTAKTAFIAYATASRADLAHTHTPWHQVGSIFGRFHAEGCVK